jgi:hypothetical protein
VPSVARIREVERVLARGAWPRARDAVFAQEIVPIVPASVVHTFASDEHRIVLLPPPFNTISDCMPSEGEFWHEFGALEEIDPDEALLICDFGLGSETVVIVDFRHDPSPVLRLNFYAPLKTRWLKVADSVEGFRRMLEID